jgi:uncharacterized membrane protein YfcA
MAFPELAAWQWALGVVCAVLVGLAKTGVPGFGIFVVPLMVLTVGDARLSAGWLLPLLSTADVIAVIRFRRHAAAGRLFALTPWVFAGMLAGAAALAWPEAWLRPLVGGIVLVMVALRLVRRAPDPSAVVPARWFHPAGYGIAAGFATTVANAAGPVMNMYLFAKRLPKDEFIATGAWFFLVINLGKLPLYAGRGLISGSSLLFDLVLVPAVIVGTTVGRQISARLPQRMFERIVLALTTVAALLLLAPAFLSLLSFLLSPRR